MTPHTRKRKAFECRMGRGMRRPPWRPKPNGHRPARTVRVRAMSCRRLTMWLRATCQGRVHFRSLRYIPTHLFRGKPLRNTAPPMNFSDFASTLSSCKGRPARVAASTRTIRPEHALLFEPGTVHLGAPMPRRRPTAAAAAAQQPGGVATVRASAAVRATAATAWHTAARRAGLGRDRLGRRRCRVQLRCGVHQRL